MYAPDRTCPKCGWSGKDWGFKYHRYCTKCHNEWRKKKAEERLRWRRAKPLNENIELANGVVVTRNVEERLKKKAHCEAPHTKGMFLSEWCGDTILSLSFCTLFVAWMAVWLDPQFALISIACTVLGFLLAYKCNRRYKEEEARHKQQLATRLDELARERQRRIDETNAFYTSVEWRLLREQVIQEQGRVCQECKKRIADDYDVTVDHIKPRSKFPELAREKSNLQVLCRKCNSGKGTTYEKESIDDESSEENTENVKPSCNVE